MVIVNYISVLLIPLVIFIILLDAVLARQPAFSLFLKGSKQGIQIVMELAPTIIGLFVAIGVFRNSGALDLLCKCIAPATRLLHLPSELIPLSILKSISSSGANGLLFEIFKMYGPDSFIGFAASLLLCCSETLFYTVSVYFMRVKITKTRWTIPCGILLAMFSLFISVWIAGFFVQK